MKTKIINQIKKIHYKKVQLFIKEIFQQIFQQIIQIILHILIQLILLIV